MVLLTMTPAIVAAINKHQSLEPSSQQEEVTKEPSLKEPKPGNPVSHTQLIQISKYLQSYYERIQEDRNADKEPEKEEQEKPIQYHLNDLLRGSTIYIAPPPPKPEPTSEYKALMARLRKEEEARAYERMLHPPPAPESFSQRFPSVKAPFSVAGPSHMPEYGTNEDDDVTYADIDRQLTLIINMLVTIIACSIGIWIVARHWPVPKRLFVSMGGGGLIGIAEVVIYAGYIRRVKEAKTDERKIVERKEVLDSWVIEPRKANVAKGTGMQVLGEDLRDVRARKGKK